MKSKFYKCSVSFFVSYICMTLIFGLLGIIGGRLSMFQGDDFQQYLVFITDFINTIRGEGSIWYSFSNYIGSGNILTIAYYCLSPFNVFFFLCGDNFFLAYYLIVVLKISLAAATFCYFIMHLTKKEKYYYIIASLFYALSGYSVILYLDIMWLDAIYILPILIVAIIRYIESDKYYCLILVYSILFITNFYMGFIVGVFSAIFFVSYLLFSKGYNIRINISFYIRKSLGYFGVVMLAIGICAGLLLPTAGFLSQHMAHDNVEFSALVANLFDIVNTMFIGEFQTMDNRVPLLYAGIPTFALVFFFFINSKISKNEKLFWGVQILFYIFGMLMLPIYKFLHAFDYPNYYGYRFSFVVVFLLVSISCISIDKIDIADKKFFKLFAIIAPVFYSVMMTFQNTYFAGDRLNSQSGLAINFCFIVAWLFLLGLAVKYGFFGGADNGETDVLSVKKQKSVRGMALILTVLELVLNGYICIKNTDFVHIEKSLINGWYYSERQAIDTIKESDTDFYRIYINNDVNTNSGKMFGFNGLNTFSSADNYDLRMALCRLGQSTSNRYMRSNCSVPAFDSLFSVKYYIDIPKFEDYINIDNVNDETGLSATIKKNDYALSLGYMVNSDIITYSFSNNAFDNIERLCSAMTGVDSDIFEDVILREEYIGLNNYKMNMMGGRLYFNRISALFNEVSGVAIVVPGYTDDRYLEFSYNSPGSYPSFPVVYTQEEGAYHSKLVAEGGVYKMGELDGDNYVTLGASAGSVPDFFVNSINIADYKEEGFIPVYEELSKNQYNIITNDIDYISGTVIATEDKPFLFTTIPYDPEWHIYVDGKPITRLYRVVGDAFMAIELEPGEHIVTFQYVEKWSDEGYIISLISVSIFIMMILVNVMMTIRRKDSNIKKIN